VLGKPIRSLRHLESEKSPRSKCPELIEAERKSGAPGEIRTPDLLLRRQSKYPWPTKNQVFIAARARHCAALSAPIEHILHTASTHLSRFRVQFLGRGSLGIPPGPAIAHPPKRDEGRGLLTPAFVFCQARPCQTNPRRARPCLATERRPKVPVGPHPWALPRGLDRPLYAYRPFLRFSLLSGRCPFLVQSA
jgi:hypothetical protein